MNAEALVLHRLAFLGGGLGPGRLAAAEQLSQQAHGLPPFVALQPVHRAARGGGASSSSRSPTPASAWKAFLLFPAMPYYCPLLQARPEWGRVGKEYCSTGMSAWW